jgi:hypothetical protein
LPWQIVVDAVLLAVMATNPLLEGMQWPRRRQLRPKPQLKAPTKLP